ncbi:DNA gyrase/topoisomerase IV subunit A [Microbacterium sp. SORGH_AS454]|nr:DNA gyrase/topoisomerase IV subunit A [Microbacterium sp. SORGH_AS_0454]
MPDSRSSSPSNSSVVERIEDVDVSTEMQGSFLEYAYSVIYSRALPDARDGLKPVQRRILYQMAEMGLRPDRGHVKSARVVGEVMGKLHPHGDAPIYDALVRLAQYFSLRVPLVDGHGNFGSLDDGPAAPRYTEARLAAAALALTENLDEDVVDFIPNYDGQFQQPEVLPAAFPNLLVNGATGIAVGMATNMAPHNLIEVVAAAIHLLQHPEATVEELMEFVPGPDLPSGGIIVGLDGIKDAYTNGRGTFRTRAKASIESLGPRRTGIVITELPYLVGPERVIEKIKDAVQAKKLTGIADVTDLTDRNNGLRLVIGIKTGFDPKAVLEQLYRLTPLEDSFGINNVALVDGQPQTLGLREMLRVYIDHRIRVVTRRSEYRLARKRERLHLVEGLLIAILDIDEVIQVIRSSDDGERGAHEAAGGLRPFAPPGRVHPRAAPASTDEVLAHRARGRARPVERRDRPAGRAPGQRDPAAPAGGERAGCRGRGARHPAAHHAAQRRTRAAPFGEGRRRRGPADRGRTVPCVSLGHRPHGPRRARGRRPRRRRGPARASVQARRDPLLGRHDHPW